MSLPDTVFIFVLALIIFGPKKLPEIGRQIGKLVGEFRRASNEFKYQIEEEMRQIDVLEKPAKKSIATPLADATDSEAIEPAVSEDSPDDAAANFPVGQHPNIDMLDTSELSDPDEMGYYDYDEGSSASEIEPDGGRIGSATLEPAAAAVDPAAPVIMPAEGSQPRTAAPFTQEASTGEARPVPAPAEQVHVETEVSRG